MIKVNWYPQIIVLYSDVVKVCYVVVGVGGGDIEGSSPRT